jgi:hypothetical protein
MRLRIGDLEESKDFFGGPEEMESLLIKIK